MNLKVSVAVIAALAATAVVAPRPGASPTVTRASAGTSSRCTGAAIPAVVSTVPLPGKPAFLALSNQTLWVAIGAPRLYGRGAIAALDVRTGKLLRTLRLPIDPQQLAFAFGSLWVVGESRDRAYRGVLRVQPRSGRVLAVIRAEQTLGTKIAATSTAVWVGGADIYPKGHSELAGVRFVYKIDPRRNSVVKRVRLPEGATVIDLDGDKSSLWSAGWWGVAKISDSGRVLFHEPVPGSGWSMALTPGAVWVAQPFAGNPFQRRQDKPARRVLKISTVPGVPRVTVIDLESQPGGVAALADTVWVAANGGLVRIDATAIKPTVVPIPVDVAPTYLEPFPGGVWVAERSANRIKKVC